MYPPYYILTVSILLLKSIHADNRIYPRCISSADLNTYSLDDMIHISDVVLTGRTGTAVTGDYGTNKVHVSYYYSYKSDNLLLKRALGNIQVENFPFLPSPGSSALFFLVREPSFQLALYCMAPLRDLAQQRDLSAVLDHVREVASSEFACIILLVVCFSW